MTTPLPLQGKVAIITGGTRGIGAGIAHSLAARGAKILITYASSSHLAFQIVTSITSSGGQATSIQADCTSSASPKLVVDTAIKAYGQGIDIIINNAAR